MKLIPFFVLLIIGIHMNANTYWVTSHNDSGANTLREAIYKANDNLGKDTILFQIEGATQLHTIHLKSLLPTIIDAVFLDGYSQSGANESTGDKNIFIRGDQVAPSVNDHFTFELARGSDGSTIKGLAMNGVFNDPWLFSDNGCIQIESSKNHEIYGNYLGTNGNGHQDLSIPYMFYCIRINNSNGWNKIGGASVGKRNIIAGANVGTAVEVRNSVNQKIVGNYVGIDRSGSKKIETHYGISIHNCNSCLIAQNVTSGLHSSGIIAFKSNNATISSNTIGLDASGSFAISNNIGIVISNTSNSYIYGNTISGNTENGIFIREFSSKNVLYGNSIGFNTGKYNVLSTIGNGKHGILIDHRSNQNIIGGANAFSEDGKVVALQSNFISGNGDNGIFCEGDDNIIEGNSIGLSKFGHSNPLVKGNGGNGIFLTRSASNNRIGRLPTDRDKENKAPNYIGNNGLSGIKIQGFPKYASQLSPKDVSHGNQILFNNIGIDRNYKPAGNKAKGISSMHSYELNIVGNIICDNKKEGILLDFNDGFTANQTFNVNGIVTDNSIGVIDKFITIGNGADGLVVEGENFEINSNRIASNNGHGIWLRSVSNIFPSSYVKIHSNTIGRTEIFSAGNQGSGIYIDNGYHIDIGYNTIEYNFGDGISFEEGSWNLVAFNAIRHNQEAGIFVNEKSNSNHFRLNSFGSNQGLGIELVGLQQSSLGPDIVDTIDPDQGGNDLQNFPIIESATFNSSNTLTVDGYLQSIPNENYVIEVYLIPNKNFADQTGHGEGQIPYFSFTVQADPSGLANFSVQHQVQNGKQAPVNNSLFTAIATRFSVGSSPQQVISYYSTSEFSPNIQVKLVSNFKASNVSTDHSATLFPNPAMDEVNVSFTMPDDVSDFNIEIIDHAGKQVHQLEEQAFPSSHVIQPLDISYLPDGFYFVHITTGTERMVEKLVVY